MDAPPDYWRGPRHQMSFDIGDGGELVTVMPKLFDRDLDFHFRVPDAYEPSAKMDEASTAAWRSRVAQSWLRPELQQRIFDSLDRLPDLEPGQDVGVCYSGGKDSAAIMALARMRYPVDRIFTMFADTGDEWPETYEHIPHFIEWAGIRDFRPLDSMGIHTLLREKIPCWPIMKRRHCTKNLKMLPMRDHLDLMGYNQVRKDRKPPRFRPTHEKAGADIEVLKPAPLLMSGERRMEGMGRSDLPIEPERDELLMRVTARAVIEWSIVDVWEFLFWLRAPYNPVYQWIKRVACAGCPFAGDDEMYELGARHPEMLERWVETERIIGVPRLGGESFAVVQERMKGAVT